MTLRPAPGQQLAAGRLRVDATKAIAKLREYQLVDRTAWILEAIRAAVAAGAERIDLQGDSNDVWLSWSGAPWPADDLPRLFDELVSPEPTAERQHVRLLAAAVNSALGANPAYVDIYAISDGAVRVRYTPDVLEAPAPGELPLSGDESPLRKVQAHAVGIPHGVSRGMHVHFRRRASLEVVSYWLRRADPPELVMARSACSDIATPILIGETTFHRDTASPDVVRVPLGDDLDGWIAISEARDAGVEFALAERGVRLETTTIDLGFSSTVPIPIRVVVDAPRLPTNASRSEVRRDTHPISTAERRAKELVPALIAQLVERCKAGDARARQAALQLLASQIAGEDWAMRAREVQPPLRALAELPLVRDAVGVPRPLTWTWSGLVHFGDEPLAQDLAPWLAQVLWSPPGDATSAFTTGWYDADALQAHVRLAKQERRAEKKFYKHAKREAKVLGRRKPRVRARLGAPLQASCIPDHMFANVAGEVCLYRERRGGELTLLLGGREIESIEFDSALGFAAVIDSELVRPTDRFRGVVRDAHYAHVERAMRAGIVRAIESIALARADRFVDGYQVAVESPLEDDIAMIRHGVMLARNLSVPLGAAFEHAAIWRTTDGYRSIAELREFSVLGVVAPHARVEALPDRPMVYAGDSDLALLAELLRAQLIRYEASHLAERVSPEVLAETVMGALPHALAFEEDGRVVAIVPADEPQIVLHHRGRRLALWEYTPALAPCAIAIDCDRIVPDEQWSGVADDGGLGTRDYGPWERRLACEVVRAILGERSLELIGGAPVELTGTLGRWLCFSLLAHADPKSVLGEELHTRLRMSSLFRVLGQSRAVSIDELAVMYPDTILFVDHVVEPVDEMPVIVAETLVARLAAKLARRKFRNAAEDLAKRRLELARDLRLAQHRGQPAVPFELAGTHVPLQMTFGRALVGVGRDVMDVQILVENRPFHAFTRSDVPLRAIVAIDDLTTLGENFDRLAHMVDEKIVLGVRNRAPELLRAIAQEDPAALADAGPRRALLGAFVANHVLPLDIRDTLARTIQFPTVQGGRATIIQARRGSGICSTTWTGEWLAADGDEHELDRPVISTAGAPELGTILAALAHLVDVTPEVERLQTQRRIARGLLPLPKVVGADPGLTKPIAELGAAFRQLGPGEIALVGGTSEVLLHANGELRERVPLDCLPAVQLAIENADLVGRGEGAVDREVGAQARQLASLLARRVLLSRPAETLPTAVRQSLRTAIIAAVLPLRDAAVFETVTGAWIDLAAVQAQRELLGDLWSLQSVPPDHMPLDPRRIVLVLSKEQQALAKEHGIPVIDAAYELALDGRARRNQERPRAESLAVEGHGILAQVELDGDGITAPRGTVAVLSPDAAHRRQLRMFRAMHPFDVLKDPCRWPTLATIDDARFTPDRTWEHPERDAAFKEAIEVLHRKSNDALRAIVQPPASALASIRVAPWTYDSVTLLRGGDIQLRGAVWLEGPPLPLVAPSIRVVGGGIRSFVPLRGIGLAGTIYAHVPNQWEAEAILEALCQYLHAKLVKELALARRKDADLVAAHVALALALERITPADAKALTFACFRPAPLDAQALSSLLMARDEVIVVPPTSRYQDPCFVDDGSHTARVIRSWLGSRMRAPTQRRRPDTVEPPPPMRVEAHPLQPFIDTLHARIIALGVQVARWRLVDDREEPLAKHTNDTLEIAALNPHVLQTAADLAANTAWSRDAVDAIAAHCITVLNIALAAITDATEARAIGKLLTS